MQADIVQKYARHQNAYVTTVSFFAPLMLPLHALTQRQANSLVCIYHSSM